MTNAQAMRARRKAITDRAHHERMMQRLQTLGLIALVILLFSIAGTGDYADTKAEMERWERQGIEVSLGW